MRCSPLLKRMLAILLATMGPNWAQAAEAQIAVAANFAEPIKALAAELAQTTRHKIRITLGASGKLYAQIKHGAPFDALLAANQQIPQALESDGLASPGSRFTYAKGKLVLWSATAGRVDDQGAILNSPSLGKVAYANPKTAPYGAAAEQLIAAMGLTRQLAPRLVQGESIGQTYAFVYTGNADVGFVALSQVMADGKLQSGSVWQPPPSLYQPIQQDAVLLQRGANNPAAIALMQLLKSPRGQALIRSYGYDI